MKINKKDNFFSGIIILFCSQIIIKILGLTYSIYLTNKDGFGDNGNAIYMSGYQIYALLLTLSSIGVPNAIAKLISEKIAKNEYYEAERILKIAVILFSIIGFVGMLILYYGGKFISNEILQIPEAENTIKILAPAIFFVSILSVFRGYFNGIGMINNTAKSQTIEQLFKTIFTIIFVEIVCNITWKDTISMSAGATLATTMATFFSFIYILIKYLKYSKKFEINDRKRKKESASKILKNILAISIPISMSSLISAVNKNIDSITVVRLLSPIIGESLAKSKYGILSSKADTLVSLPLAFNIAISTTLVPTISKALAQNDEKTLNEKIKESLFLSALIGIPATFGMAMYSKQILKLLFPNASLGNNLLFIESFSIIFAIFNQTINSILQGIGKSNTPVVALSCGVVSKLILNLLLIPIEGIYENGAAIGTVGCNIVAFMIVYNALNKSLHLDFNLINIISVPLFSTIIMCAISYIFYLWISKIVIYQIATILSIIIAVSIYFCCVKILSLFNTQKRWK